MKNKIMYILMGLLIYPVLADITMVVDHKLNTEVWSYIGVPSYGLYLGLTGRCDNYVRPSGVTNAEYFGCGQLNILISNLLYKEE